MTNYKNSWNDKDIDKLGRALAFAYKNSDTFGQPLELEARIDAFRFVLEDDYTVNDVLGALKLHMKATTEMIKPAHIHTSLTPAQPKISTAEFVHAQKQWEINGYKSFCEHKDVVDDYRAQELGARDTHAQITDERFLKITNGFKTKDDSRAVTSPDGYEKLN